MNVKEIEAVHSALDAAVQARDYLWANRRRLRAELGDEFGWQYAAVEHAVFVAAETYREEQDQPLKSTVAAVRAKTRELAKSLEALKTAVEVIATVAAVVGAAVALAQSLSPL